MQFSLDWLGRYVELPGGDPTAVAEELAAALTAVGLAVEGIDPRPAADAGAHAGDGVGDVLLDVDVTTNRTDAMNHLGLAREVAVKLGRELRPPAGFSDDLPEPPGDPETVAGVVSVTLADPVGCRRYVARVFRGVRVGESPAWLQDRLRSIGLRPINNVVDVTNFVLWETGQPLHAFDLARIPEGRIVVRRAARRERLTTLDGEQRELGEEVLVIADRERPVALAGVMGGLDSEVTAATTDVLLESAHFDRRRVRIGARELGLHTDASHRFERGADPGACLAAANRAAALIAEVAGGRVLAGAVDERGEPLAEPSGVLDGGRLTAFAGFAVPPEDVERWLRGLGFTLEPVTGDGGAARRWRVAVPSWRWYDVPPSPEGPVYEADLFEEVLRLRGYDAVPSTLPALPGSDGPRTPELERRERVRDHLAGCGYAEAVSYVFHSRHDDAALPSLAPADSVAVALVNPLSERYAVLRRSLLPNLVEGARFNLRRGAPAVRLFEVGHVFWQPASRGAHVGDALVESESLAWVCGGSVGRPWDRRVELDLFDWKGVLDSLAERLGGELEVRPAELAGLVAGTAAEVFGGDGRRVGFFGRLDEPELETPLYAGELAMTALPLPDPGRPAGRPVEVPSRFPAVEADLTFTHPDDAPWAEIRAAIEAHRPPELLAFRLADRYRGEGVPEGAVNTTLSFRYGSPDRSLTQEEVNRHQEALRALLADRFPGGER